MYHPSYIYIQPIWTHCMCSAWLIRRSQLHGSSIHVVLFSAAGRLQGSTGWLVFTADKSQIKAARWQHQVTVRGNCTSNCVSELHPASVIDSSALMGEHATHCTVLSADRSTFNQKKKKKKISQTAGSHVHDLLICSCSLGSGLQPCEVVHWVHLIGCFSKAIDLWQFLLSCAVCRLRNTHFENPWRSVVLWSIETFTSAFLPVVNHQPHYGQHTQAQDGEENGEEELDSTHPFLLDFHCKAKQWDLLSDKVTIFRMPDRNEDYLGTGPCCPHWGWWPPPLPPPQQPSVLSAHTTSWRWYHGYLEQQHMSVINT